MQMKGNTILMTGGGSGIGRAMAEAFHGLGNEVIIAGRRKELLDEVTAANPGMRSAVLDVQNAAKLKSFAAEVAARYPKLNVLIHMAGVAKSENLLEPTEDFSIVEATIETNLIAPMRLTAALLPLLKKQEQATLMTVSSGLAFAPLAMAPTYCATKAAIHSWTQSLRYSLRTTKVEVVELIPPYVQTKLMGPHQATDPNAMPLDEYVAEVMELLKTQPEAEEICVERVMPQRTAEQQGSEKYRKFFTMYNDQIAASAAY